jgi:predicted RNA-binding Zn-ribbon protein involved in translation (DUF1610 family)
MQIRCCFPKLITSYKKHCLTELHKTGKRKPRKDKQSDSYTCEKCNFNTTNKLNLKVHTLNNHSTKEERKNGFKYYCEKCDFGVASETTFNIHLKTKRHQMKTS